MSNLLYSIFFGAGVAALAYYKIGPRLGYGNSQNIWTMVGVIFVLSTIVFWTIMATAINPA